MKSRVIAIIAAAIGTYAATAVNPYLPLWEFIPDGEPYVFEDPDHPGKFRVYIYGSHDIEDSMYCGRNQVVWSASVDNLNDWRYDGVIFESKKDRDGNWLYPDSIGDVLYAPDVTSVRERDGRIAYYLYPNNQAWGRNGMVAKSYRPDGPFEVCNWSKTNPTETDGVLRFDPAVFTDDDGRVYGYWGFNNSWGAELDPKTMATVKPGTKAIEDLIPGNKQDTVFRFFEASSMRKIKDKYVLIYSRITNDGEFGLWPTNYTLAYCYSTSPLGPFTYGGTIIDGRGKEKQPDGSIRATATYYGNTHGSILEINGQWYVFYHRQAGTTEFSRQAMVAPITVDVEPGPNGRVSISEAEYTSEGFELDGLDPFRKYAAGIACYYTNSVAMHQEYPHMIYPGSHSQICRMEYDGKTEPYDPSINICPMVNNTSGSVVGYKYYNFSKTKGLRKLSLNVEYTPEGVEGSIEIYADSPDPKRGVKVGVIKLSATDPQEMRTATVDARALKKFEGKHSLFFVFNSQEQGKSLCALHGLQFVK